MKNYLKVVGLIFLVAFSSCEEKNFEMDLPEITFAVNSTGSLPDLIMGERLKISYEIAEEGISNYNEYTLVFSSSENGYLTVNSKDYLAGEKIEVPSLNFVAFYTPTAPGEHLITSDITASSNQLVQTSEVYVEVEGASFDFNIAAPIEVTVGETIDLNFNVNELGGDSTLAISYLINGVNGEFKDANNVVLSAGKDYDVENSFKWTLKGIEQGTMAITFSIVNQYGLEKSKILTIEVLPIDFDFNVRLLDNNLTLEKPIRFRFDMNAPDVLDYDLSFTANTGGRIEIIPDNLLEDDRLRIGNTSFDAKYYAALAGNAFLTFTITASNGVTKTKSINFNIIQAPRITTVQEYSGNCGPTLVPRQSFRINWVKDPTEAIVSAEIKLIGNGTNITKRKTFHPPLTGNNNIEQIFVTGCTSPPSRIEVTVVDSRGQESVKFTKDY